MIEEANIIGLAGSVGVGVALKNISALVQARIEYKAKEQEIRLRELEAMSKIQNEKAKIFYGDDACEKMGDVELSFGFIKIKYPKYVGASGTFTRWTRRMLAITIVWTYCYLLLLWGANPDVEISVWQSTTGGAVELFWGLISFPQKEGEVIRITSGSLVWGMTYVTTMIMTAYFMPVGNK